MIGASNIFQHLQKLIGVDALLIQPANCLKSKFVIWLDSKRRSEEAMCVFRLATQAGKISVSSPRGISPLKLQEIKILLAI